MITDSAKYLKVKILTFHFHKHYFQLSKPLHVLRMLKYIIEDSFREILKAAVSDAFLAPRKLVFPSQDVKFSAYPTPALNNIPPRRVVICANCFQQCKNSQDSPKVRLYDQWVMRGVLSSLAENG
jgi:hypothetical protein